MLDAINFEVFGAFSAVFVLLIWLVLYFKRRYEKEQKVKENILKKQEREKAHQLEVLNATLEVLRAQLEREQDRD